MAPTEVEASRGRVTERRIAWLTLFLGFTPGVIVALLGHTRCCAGLVIATLLAWLNFRWLRRGANTFALASKVQAASQNPHRPIVTHFLLVFRYILITF